MGSLDMHQEFRDFLLLSTNESQRFADGVYKHLGAMIGPENLKPTGHVRGTYHNDGEFAAQIETNARRKRAYYVHHFCGREGQYDPIHGEIKMYRIDGAFERSSTLETTYIMPYLINQRQDRSTRPRECVSVKDFLRRLHCNRLVTFDLHTPHIREYADYPIIDLYADPVLEDAIRTLGLQNVTVFSPDAGGVARARRLAKYLDAPVAMADKRREKDGEVDEIRLVGDVHGRTVVIRDDILDTAGTVETVCQALREGGAIDVIAVVTHGLYSPKEVTKEGARVLEPAEDRIRRAHLKVVATNSIPRSEDYLRKNSDWLIQTVQLEEMTASALYQLQISEGSISTMFRKDPNLINDTLRPAR